MVAFPRIILEISDHANSANTHTHLPCCWGPCWPILQTTITWTASAIIGHYLWRRSVSKPSFRTLCGYNCATFEMEKHKTGFTTNNTRREKAKTLNKGWLLRYYTCHTVCVAIDITDRDSSSVSTVNISGYETVVLLYTGGWVLTLPTGLTYERNM